MFFVVGQTGGNSLAFLYFLLYGSAGFSNTVCGLYSVVLRAVLMRLYYSSSRIVITGCYARGSIRLCGLS